MSNEKESSTKEKKSGNGNGQDKYPTLVTDDLQPDPDVPGRYTYDPVEEADATRPRFKACKGLVNNMTAVKWLIKNFLEKDSFGLIFGESEAYKSFLIIDLCMSVATGTPWHGNSISQGSVVYICGEGHSGIGRRLAAWLIHHGLSLDTEVPLFVSHGAINLMEPESIVSTKSAIDDLLGDETPVLIAVDTLARNFGGGNENSTEDMNSYINNTNALLRAPYEACMVTSHHVGHGDKNRARGASALRAALDFEYMAFRIDESVIVSNTKMKDGPAPKATMFDTISVDLPFADEDGKPLTSLALELNQDGPPVELKRQRRLGKNQRLAVKVLKDLFQNESAGYVDFQNWFEACRVAGVSEFRFPEVWKALKQRGIVDIRGDGKVRKGMNWDEE